eukprot:scaffold92_cov85-Cylindrotheca_fusiformis.AAC.2
MWKARLFRSPSSPPPSNSIGQDPKKVRNAFRRNSGKRPDTQADVWTKNYGANGSSVREEIALEG